MTFGGEPTPFARPFGRLPMELVLEVFSYLSHHDLTRTVLCCREWYYISTDLQLWRSLDLTFLNSKFLHPPALLPRSLGARLGLCRALTICNPPALSVHHVCTLLQHASASPHLESLTLTSLTSVRTHHLHALSTHLTHAASHLTAIDLSGSAIPSAPVLALLHRHGRTLRTLNLSFTAICDRVLCALAQLAPVLTTLGIGGCFALSRGATRRFLKCGVPARVQTLRLEWLLDLRIAWLWDLFECWRNSARRLREVNVKGCERLTAGDLERLGGVWKGVRIVHCSVESRESEVGMRRFREAVGMAGIYCP